MEPGDPLDDAQPTREAATRAARASAPVVVMFFIGDEVRAITLTPGQTAVVGRGGGADIDLPDPSLSRRHAQLALTPAGLVVRDLGSRNGTFVDGKRVHEAPVGPGASLELGDVPATVHGGSEPRPGQVARDSMVVYEPGDDGVVVASGELQAVLALAVRAARSTIPVLIVGETGVGKEVIARAIHDNGPRRGGPFRCINCGALPSSLLEGLLFGHERGAFTGATSAQPGLFESAHGGTLLLDEIGELSATAQAALLRVLETRRVARIGATTEVAVDVRVLAATHRDLEGMAAGGQFRRDLLYRLDGMTVVIPPLRARVADIEPLARHFLRAAAVAHQRPACSLTDGALERLTSYAWPGNVRELRNAMERAIVVDEDGMIDEDDLPERIASNLPPSPMPSPTAPGSATAIVGTALREQVAAHEAALILAALEANDGNQRAAARALDLPLRTLVHKLKVHGIHRTYRK